MRLLFLLFHSIFLFDSCRLTFNEFNTLHVGTSQCKKQFDQESSFVEFKWRDCEQYDSAAVSRYLFLSVEVNESRTQKPAVLFFGNFQRSFSLPFGLREHFLQESAVPKSPLKSFPKRWPSTFYSLHERNKKSKRFTNIDPFYVLGVERPKYAFFDVSVHKDCASTEFSYPSPDIYYVKKNFFQPEAVKPSQTPFDETEYPVLFFLLRATKEVLSFVDSFRYAKPAGSKVQAVNQLKNLEEDSPLWDHIQASTVEVLVLLRNRHSMKPVRLLSGVSESKVTVLLIESKEVQAGKSVVKCGDDKWKLESSSPYKDNACHSSSQTILQKRPGILETGFSMVPRASQEKTENDDQEDQEVCRIDVCSPTDTDLVVDPPLPKSKKNSGLERIRLCQLNPTFISPEALKYLQSTTDWLSDEVVTKYIALIWRQKERTESVYLLASTDKPNNFPSVFDGSTQYILWPRLRDGHFTLLMFFIAENTAHIYDPLYKSTTIVSTAYLEEIKTLAERTGSSTEPKFTMEAIFAQKDGNNCGVYVCQVAQLFLQKPGETLRDDPSFDPVTKRKEMRSFLTEQLTEEASTIYIEAQMSPTRSSDRDFIQQRAQELKNAAEHTQPEFDEDFMGEPKPVKFGALPKCDQVESRLIQSKTDSDSRAVSALEKKVEKGFTDTISVVRNGFEDMKLFLREKQSFTGDAEKSVQEAVTSLQDALPKAIHTSNKQHHAFLSAHGFSSKDFDNLREKCRFIKFHKQSEMFRCELCNKLGHNVLLGNGIYLSEGRKKIMNQIREHCSKVDAHTQAVNERSSALTDLYNLISGKTEAEGDGLFATNGMFRTVYSEIFLNIPLHRHPGLVQMQINNGAILGSHHRCPKSARRMMEVIGSNLEGDLLNYMREEKPFFSLMLDSATTTTGAKLVSIQIRIWKDFKAQTYHFVLKEMRESETGRELTEMVKQYFKERDLLDVLITRLSSVVTDAAANMYGNVNGMKGLFRSWLELERTKRNDLRFPQVLPWFHCGNHRLELAVKHHFKAGSEWENYRTFTARTLNSVKSFFGATSVARNLVLQATSHDEFLRFGGIFEVRWVNSETRAIRTFLHMLPYTISTLQALVDDQTVNHPNSAVPPAIVHAQSLLMVLKDVRIYFFLGFQLDVLEELRLASLHFQKESSSIMAVADKVQTILESLEDLKQNPTKAKSGILKSLLDKLKCRDGGATSYSKCRAATTIEGWETYPQREQKMIALEMKQPNEVVEKVHFNNPYASQVHPFQKQIKDGVKTRASRISTESMKASDEESVWQHLQSLKFYQYYEAADIGFPDRDFRTDYLSSLQEEISKEFNSQELEKFMSLNGTAILVELRADENNKDEKIAYYKKGRSQLASTYKMNADLLQSQWNTMINNMKRQNAVEHLKKFEDDADKMWAEVQQKLEEKKDEMGELLKELISKVLVIPAGTSAVERSFSAVTFALDKRRTSLSPETINYQLHVRLNGPPIDRYDPTRDSVVWIQQGKYASDKYCVDPNQEITSDSDDDVNRYSIFGHITSVAKLAKGQCSKKAKLLNDMCKYL